MHMTIDVPIAVQQANPNLGNRPDVDLPGRRGDGGSRSAARPVRRLQLVTERVIVFKDGYSLVLKRGSAVTDDKGEVFTNEVPDAAVLGSFWATPVEGRLLSMVAGWTEVKEILREAAALHASRAHPEGQRGQVLHGAVARQGRLDRRHSRSLGPGDQHRRSRKR